MSHEGVHTHLLEARSLPTKSVVVYGDRAEVKRIVKCDLYSGRNELIIQNVSAVIERQSLRVDGRDAATIQEVRYQESPIDANSNENDEVHELEERKSELETEKALVDDQLSILRKRVEVLDGVATQISRNISPSTSSTTESRDANANRISACSSSSNAPFVLNENTVTHLTHFLDFYGQTAADLKMQIRKQTKHADSLSQKIDRLERQIDQLRCGLEYDNVKRNISIIVDAEVAAPSEFHVSYQVYCASWKPSYDIRVSTANDKKETTSLTMWYYGVIEQNTGEDWKASELVLSTATPSIGGCVPPLSTLAASFRPRNDGQRKSSWKRKPTSATSDEDMGFGSFDYNELADAAALQRLTACAAQPNSDLQYSSATSYEHLPSTCFAIAHPATILGDGSDHKVTIVKFEMDAKFIHETVPARAAAAYMTALATNTSSLPLLSGPAAVYLNNSFVSKMQLELVLPGEEFYCNLGVDPSLKIEYKAATSIHEQIGFVSKCMLQTHDHVIGVRNAKANQQVQLTVKEHVPKAFDEKIKVVQLTRRLAM